MQIDISPLGDRLVRVALAGRLDTQGVDRVEPHLTEAVVPPGNSAVVDLSNVEFVSSMGIRMLLSIARSLSVRQARVALFGVPAQIGQVFEAVALNRLIPICATEAEALAAVGSAQA